MLFESVVARMGVVHDVDNTSDHELIYAQFILKTDFFQSVVRQFVTEFGKIL